MSSDDSNTDDKFRYNLEKVKEALFCKKGRPWKSFFDMSPLQKYWAIHYREAEDIEKMRAFGFDNIIRLDKKDMAVFGIFPETDPFYAVVCDICHAVIKPNSIKNHLSLRHENQKNGSRSHYPYNLTESSTARCLESLGFRASSSRVSQQYDEVYTPIIQPSTSTADQQSRKTIANKTVKNIRPQLFGPKRSSNKGKPRSARKNLDGPSTSSSSSSNSPSSVVVNKSRSNSPEPPQYLFAEQIDVSSIVTSTTDPNDTNGNICVTICAYDPDKHCGCLSYYNGQQQPPCICSLGCMTHSVSIKRAVPGRSKEFDVLFAEYQLGLKPRNEINDNGLSSLELVRLVPHRIAVKKQQPVQQNQRELEYLPESCRALSPYPEDARKITYADVLKMIIPPRTITEGGRQPVEVVSHSYRTVESDPNDPNDPYAQYRLSLPRTERYKPRIQVLIRTIDTIIDSDEEYDLNKVTRTFHDFRNISLLTETSYWKLDREKLTQSQLQPETELTKEELQRVIQSAVRTKYDKEAKSETLTYEFGERMSAYLSNEQNSKVIRQICQTGDLRKVELQSSLEGLMDLTNQDIEMREAIDIPIPGEAIFDFHIPDEFMSDQLTEVEILPEDLVQDESIAELFDKATPEEPITLENLLAVFRTEPTAKKTTVKRESSPNTSNPKKMAFQPTTMPVESIEPIQNDCCEEPIQSDINASINLIDEPIDCNTSPINFLFDDMSYQNKSITESECDEEEYEYSGYRDVTETEEDESEVGETEEDENEEEEEQTVEKLIEPIETVEPIESIETIEPIEYEHMIPSSLIDGLSSVNSTDIGPVTMELPDMLFQESPKKSPEPAIEPEEKIDEINEINEIETKDDEPEVVVIESVQPIEPEVIELIDDDEDILEIVYLGKRSESLFKKPDPQFGSFPEFDGKIPEVDLTKIIQTVVNPVRRAKMFSGVRKWHTDLPGPIMIPATIHKRCGGGLTTNKKQLPIRKTLLNQNDKTSSNVFEMNNSKKNGESSTSGTNLFKRSLEMNHAIKKPIEPEIIVIPDDEELTTDEEEAAIMLRCRHSSDMEILNILIKNFDEHVIREREIKRKVENIIPEFPDDTDRVQRKQLEAKIAHVDTEQSVRRTKAITNKQRIDEQTKKMQHKTTCKKFTIDVPAKTNAPLLCDCQMAQKKKLDDFCNDHNYLMSESQNKQN